MQDGCGIIYQCAVYHGSGVDGDRSDLRQGPVCILTKIRFGRVLVAQRARLSSFNVGDGF